VNQWQPQPRPTGGGLGTALIVVLVILAGAWAYYSGGVRGTVCPHPVVVHGYTLSCDGHMPSPDPTGAGR